MLTEFGGKRVNRRLSHSICRPAAARFTNGGARVRTYAASVAKVYDMWRSRERT